MPDERLSMPLDHTHSHSATPVKQQMDSHFLSNLLLALSCLVAAYVFLPRFAPRLPDLGRNSQYRLATSRIEITPPPHWVPHDLVEQVTKRAGLPTELSLLDEDLTQRVAQAFEQHPWVKGNVHVRASVPAQLQVDLEYREPVAMVRAKNGLFPIDVDAVVLPAADFSPAQIGEVSRRGKRWFAAEWSGRDSLARRHGSRRGAARGVAEVALAGVRLEVDPCTARPQTQVAWDELSFQLGTTGGSRIIWGRPPGSKRPGELPAEKKIERMKYYLRQHGPFDSSLGPCEFDITHWCDISRKPIAERGAPARRRS